MAERMIHQEEWHYIERVLANGEVAEKGKMACVELTTGELVVGRVDTTIAPIGTFEQTLTGDGTKKVRVRLFRPIRLTRWKNHGADLVLDADFQELCYIVDGETVAKTNGTNTRASAGRIWAVTSAGVLVEMGAL